jgi:hypothetical protein
VQAVPPGGAGRTSYFIHRSSVGGNLLIFNSPSMRIVVSNTTKQSVAELTDIAPVSIRMAHIIGRLVIRYNNKENTIHENNERSAVPLGNPFRAPIYRDTPTLTLSPGEGTTLWTTDFRLASYPSPRSDARNKIQLTGDLQARTNLFSVTATILPSLGKGPG